MIESPFLVPSASLVHNFQVSSRSHAVPDFDGLFRAPPAFGAKVRAAGLSKSYGQQKVLVDLDLEVKPGEFLAVVGRSGCGKSTLLRLLAGLETPDIGEISFDFATSQSTHVARIMFQEPRLLPWASVQKNVEVGLGSRRIFQDAERRAAEALNSVGLGSRAHEWPSFLSGGQKQRVALARALVSVPRFLALDEPLGALDALTRIEMQSLLEHVWLQQKFTAVLVTHDVNEALTLADRVILIEGGRVKLDLKVDLPRPRQRSAVDFTTLEDQILRELLKKDDTAPDYTI